MLTGIYVGGIYGGAITAITVRIPGAPANMMTMLDGYAMTEKGKPEVALGLATFSSFVGGIAGGVVLVLFAPQLARVTLECQSPEMFSLVLLALVAVAMVTSGSVVKSTATTVLGLMLSTAGLDRMLPVPRFTLGITNLLVGIPLLPVVIGLFALSEFFWQVGEREPATTERPRLLSGVPHQCGASRADRASRLVLSGKNWQDSLTDPRRRTQMKRKGWLVIIVVFGVLTMAPQVRSAAEDDLDYQMLTRIRDEGLGSSQVMDHASWLTDVYGPRLTGTPAIAQAADWIAKRFDEWGLSGIHRETFPFGDGWSLVRFSAHLVEPQVQPLIGYPKTWTPGTDGAVIADVVRVDIGSEADMDDYRGKLGGKIVLTQPERDVAMLEGAIVGRWTEELLKAAELTPFTERDSFLHAPRTRRPPSTEPTLQDKIRAFFVAEGVVAQLDRGSDDYMRRGDNQMEWMTQRTDGGTVFIGHGPRGVDPAESVPSVTLAVEHYNRMVRVLEKDVPVRVELDIQVQFHEEAEAEAETNENGFNLLAELPGTDLAHEVVLLGAHLDSYPWATGATDNASGVAVMMEVMRILKTVGAAPRRTIRVGLWGAEENGLIGSRAYALAHLVDGDTTSLKPDHEHLSAYYNIDNGTGRIRGVWLQGNFEAEPIFRQWMQPLRDLGVETIAPRSVRGSDYMTFDDVGIPAFQFMQDRLEYNSRTHHSNMDFYDHLDRDALVQMPVIVASFAYNTAMRDDKLPRKPLP